MLSWKSYGRGPDKFSQTLIHQLHQENWLLRLRISNSAKILDNVGVLDGAENLALLMKLVDVSTWGME